MIVADYLLFIFFRMLEEKYESKIQAEKTSQEELGKYFTDLANLLECEAKPQSCILKVMNNISYIFICVSLFLVNYVW